MLQVPATHRCNSAAATGKMFACVLAASACVGHVSGSVRICQVAVRRVLLTPSSGSRCEDAGFIGVNRNERDEAAAHASL